MTWPSNQPIVIPIDFSDDSFSALETAGQLAVEPSRIHVVHVLPIMEPTEPGIIWHTIDDEGRSRHAEDALRKQLERRGYERMPVVIRFGDPGNEVAQYAREIGAGLIIVPSHGRSGWQRLLIGSVADRIVHLAHCPVLVLKK